MLVDSIAESALCRFRSSALVGRGGASSDIVMGMVVGVLGGLVVDGGGEEGLRWGRLLGWEERGNVPIELVVEGNCPVLSLGKPYHASPHNKR